MGHVFLGFSPPELFETESLTKPGAHQLSLMADQQGSGICLPLPLTGLPRTRL